MSYFDYCYTKPTDKIEFIKSLIDDTGIDSIILNYSDGYFDRFIKIGHGMISIDNQTDRMFPFEKVEMDSQYNICFEFSIGEYGKLEFKVDLNAINQYWM